MIFTSLPFLAFFVAFFLLYWFVFNRNLKAQNLFILAGSYAFYAWGDWRFLPLLIGSSILNYLLGILIERSERDGLRRFLLLLGLLQGLGWLLFFKYTNFLVSSLSGLISVLHGHVVGHPLHLILPLGISFYTFRSLSYLLDIYKGKIKPVRDWVVFFSYVAFFPSLISGPIDKAKTLVPQLLKQRRFDYAEANDGMRQIGWGLFKKLVIANNCAPITTEIFANYDTYSGSTLLLGAFLYTIQIYTDFSGYSDIAIGLGRLLGFSITKNFDFPLFSRNIAEFWRKWHMSLTEWLTEYVFTPLSIAFRDFGKAGVILAILINFTAIGIWHGANWTFVLFGFLHGCYFIPLILRGTLNRKGPRKAGGFPPLPDLAGMIGTFCLVMLTFVIFKADSIPQAFDYLHRLFSRSLFSHPDMGGDTGKSRMLLFVLFFLLLEWVGRNGEYAVSRLGVTWPRPARWALYYAFFAVIFFFGGRGQNFIYFQF